MGLLSSIAALRRRTRLTCMLAVAVLVWTSAAGGRRKTATSSAASQTAATVTDIALTTGYQDYLFGHFKRGRTTIAADFDNDGRVDFFVGNPGDESFVLRNTAGSGGLPSFVLAQTLLIGELAASGGAADYDNDGDWDLFVAVGGSEGTGFSHLFKNLWMESGQKTLSFQDVTAQAGVSGPVPPGQSAPIPVAAEGAAWGDYDNDGWADLFVSVNIGPGTLPIIAGRNILWRNNHNGTFTDTTKNAGLSATLRGTRHSSWIDFDNDGDLDLFENNYVERNVLWRNLLKDTGKPFFEDVTSGKSAPGQDLGYPLLSYASAVADFNNDGWQDLLVVMRGPGPEPGSPYPPGHALFLNLAGKSFTNVAQQTTINTAFQPVDGVMGCQVGDLNADGVPDVFLGEGSPTSGHFNQFYLSDSGVNATPHFLDRSYLIGFPAPVDPSRKNAYVAYPYKAHGSVIVDADGDGALEIAVADGGPIDGGNVNLGNLQREPNRLFKFSWGAPLAWFKVRALGDGKTVSRDAFNTRFNLTVSVGSSGTPWVVRGTLVGNSGFSAQNGPEVYFGLRNATQIRSLEVIWPDGTRKTITSGLTPNTTYTVQR